MTVTFEEWFEQRFPAGTPEGIAARTGQFKDYLEEAWAAGHDEGFDEGRNTYRPWAYSDFDVEDCA